MLIRVFALFAIIVAAPALAEPGDESVFVVKGVVAEASAEDGVTAKDKALTEARQRALSGILRDMTRQRDHGRLPQPNGDALSAVVRDFTVQAERAMPTYYRAVIDIGFDRRAVIGLLDRVGIPHAETQAPRLLVMPLEEEGHAIVWTDDGWRAAWGAHERSGGIVPLSVFKATTEDRSYFDSAYGVPSGTALSLLALKYDAEFAVAVYLHSGKSGDMTVRVAGRDAVGPLDLTQTFGGLRGTVSPDYADAAAAVVALLEDRWKSAVIGGAVSNGPFLATREGRGGAETLEASLVPDAAGLLPDAKALDREIAAIPGVTDVRMDGAKRIRIAYDGDLGLLQMALAVRRLSLVRAGEKWWLSPY